MNDDDDGDIPKRIRVLAKMRLNEFSHASDDELRLWRPPFIITPSKDCVSRRWTLIRKTGQ